MPYVQSVLLGQHWPQHICTNLLHAETNKWQILTENVHKINFLTAENYHSQTIV